MPANLVLDEIASAFIESARRDSFNGLVAASLLRVEQDPTRLRSELIRLAEESRITGVFGRVQLNMHIKRLSDLPINRQVEFFKSEKLEEICLYPTAFEVQERIDLSPSHDRPFSKALTLAEPQLAFRAFEMSVLERYASDPRYSVYFDDYMGRMTITDPFFSDGQHLERDKVSLQTFGLGFDAHHIPYTVVFLRYLAGLSAEHQQYWHSYVVDADVRMCKPYFQSSILGEFWNNRSITIRHSSGAGVA